MVRLTVVPLIVLSLSAVAHLAQAQLGYAPLLATRAPAAVVASAFPARGPAIVSTLAPEPVAQQIPAAIEYGMPVQVGAMASTFTAIDANSSVVNDMVDKFIQVYSAEMGKTALSTTVLDVVKAEQADVHVQLQEATDSGLTAIEDVASMDFRLYLLLKYNFQSSMQHHPFVSVLRLTMNCFNASTPEAPAQLACDVQEHVDLPRRNESVRAVPAYVLNMIMNAAPKELGIHNSTRDIYFDAVEEQDLNFEGTNAFATATKPARDIMHYVRFRVRGGSRADCMLVIEHLQHGNKLRYQDTACFDDADEFEAATSSYRLANANMTVFALSAAIIGTIIAFCAIWRVRRRQRTGYSYVHSGVNKIKKGTPKDASESEGMGAIPC